MTYVMSDLHGQYEKYRKMLELIRFGDSDDLYILGDVVDRGPEPVEFLRDMSGRINVFPLLGNHDLTAALLLKQLFRARTEDSFAFSLTPEVLETVSLWLTDGGQTTFDGFRKLPGKDRRFLLLYPEEFFPYETVTAGGHTFFLVHGGVPWEKRNVLLSEQSVYDLVSERPDYSKRYYRDAYLVTGHTPTLHIGEEYRGRIFKGNGHIAVDCGAGFCLPLGCIRLEDLREFYVE